jgi:hypothetical protein
MTSIIAVLHVSSECFTLTTRNAGDLEHFKPSHVCLYLEQHEFPAEVVAAVRKAHITGKAIMRGMLESCRCSLVIMLFQALQRSN